MFFKTLTTAIAPEMLIWAIVSSVGTIAVTTIGFFVSKFIARTENSREDLYALRETIGQLKLANQEQAQRLVKLAQDVEDHGKDIVVLIERLNYVLCGGVPEEVEIEEEESISYVPAKLTQLIERASEKAYEFEKA